MVLLGFGFLSMKPLKKLLAGILLVALIATKSGFWFALISFTQHHEKLHLTPCACTGQPVCPCGPGGCCANDPSPTFHKEKLAVHSPKVCGSFSKGEGPFLDPPEIVTLICPWVAEGDSGADLRIIVLTTFSTHFDPPEPPIPKTGTHTSGPGI